MFSISPIHTRFPKNRFELSSTKIGEFVEYACLDFENKANLSRF